MSARILGDQRDSDGLGLFIVEKSASGVSTQDYPTVDGNRASEVTLENVTVGADALIGDAGNGLALLEEALDYGIGAVCAEAIGHMKCLNDATVEYCKTRKQFGVPIGSFQVLQHRMVDMFMEYEQSVSMTYMVNMKLTESEAERKKAAAGAKVQIGKSGRFVGQEAVQLHGGMGMTEEQLDVPKAHQQWHADGFGYINVDLKLLAIDTHHNRVAGLVRFSVLVF